MPFFTSELRKYFGANNGAYSQVTSREATGDKSITLDTYEKDIIHTVYPYDSFTRKGGGLNTSNASPYRKFIVHDRNNSTNLVELSIVYPKSQGNELRLYFRRFEFEADTNDYWYIFTKDGENIPHIGSMSTSAWEKLLNLNPRDDEHAIVYQAQQNIDDEDEEYQKQIGAAAVKLPTVSTSLKYQRSSTIALNALKSAKYKCEADPSHETFITANGKPYMECHHLIPVSIQPRFTASLDVEENIVSLCPLCHRQVHYGTGEPKRELLDKLWNIKKEELLRREIGIRYEDFLAIYMG